MQGNVYCIIISCLILIAFFICSKKDAITLEEATNVVPDNFCSKDKLSFFKLLDAPDEGYIYDPNVSKRVLKGICDDDPTRCKIQFLRSFLPDSAYYLNSLKDSRRNRCDSRLSTLLDSWLTNHGHIMTHPGYNYTEWSQKISIAKYARFAAMLQYKLFSGQKNDTLINFYYPGVLGWAWSDSVSNCTGNYSNWNCAFEKFRNSNIRKSIAQNTNIATNMDEIFSYRQKKIKHIIQVLLFGKLLSIISRPSNLVKKYMADNIVSINPSVWNKNPRRSKSFESYDDFLLDTVSIDDTEKVFTSVSMHGK